jgi:polysaccharide pyruvyl transferase WcaK-like protein
LLVVTGGGLLTDAFERGAEAVLDELELALSFGVPVAMVGQGLGPLESPRLKRRAREVLPRLGLIASREGQVGPALLRSLGVDPSCVVVTGDDAVELSYGLRAQRPAAKGLGVSLRVAGYSDLDDGDLERVGSVLRAVAARLGTGLVPLPTSSHPGELDIASIQRALSTETETSFPASPAEAAAAVGRCRVVVTGSYHVAVFALAQGIPAVCLAKSDYYDWKHRGLAHLFGRGCDVVHLRSGALEDELAARVEAAWSSAEEVREPLLAAARRQIEAGREAYDRLPGLLSR